MNRGYQNTLYASYVGYITQAIVNHLAPLLFVFFQESFQICIGQIGFLVTYNFAVQIIVDVLAARYAEGIGYRSCVVAAHIFSALGLAGLAAFPTFLWDPYVGLLLAVTIYAIGSGLLEVMINPIVQALPLDEKSGAMSLLHAFYCWGHALVVILTTVFLHFVGSNFWRLLVILWAVVPVCNAVAFTRVPIRVLSEDTPSMPAGKLWGMKIFWLFVILMICSGASEQAMSQWASYFAERGLQVSKSMGDLLGPCLFAVFMGTSRTVYGIKGSKLPLVKFIGASGVLCVASYILAVAAPVPILSLTGCALCGLSVGIMWPGVVSLAAEHCPQGGTAMFALLALAGDLGCSSGPSVGSGVSELFGGELKAGLLAAILFPILLLIGIGMLRKTTKPGRKIENVSV